MPPKKPSFPEEAAMQQLLDVKHPLIGIFQLVLGLYGRFDPLMMDAGCQGKVPGLIKADTELRAKFEAMKVLDKVQGLAQQWFKDHDNDLPVTKVKTVADVNGKVAAPPQLENIIAWAKEALGDDLFKNLGLCVSTTASAKRFPEETGSNFMWLDSNPYRPLPAGLDPTEKNRVNLTYGMRADLARLSTGCVTDNIRAVATDTYRNAVTDDTPSAWTDLADQLAEALRFMHTAVIPKGGTREIVVQNLLIQTLSILVHCFRTGQGFTTEIRRMEMVPVETGPGDDDEGEAVNIGETEQEGDYTYRLTDMRSHLWVPGKDSFQHQEEVDDEEEEKPRLHIELFSYYRKGSGSDGGLITDNDDEFFANLTDPNTDIFWLIVQILTAHPAYTGHAKEGSPKDLPVYEKVCVPQAISVTSTYRRCPRLILRKLAPGETALSLTSLRKEALSHAVSLQLSKGAEFTRVSEKHVSERRRTPVHFMIKHIRIMSFRETRETCEATLKLHAGPLRLGGYIARVGDQGLSCMSREIAQKIQDTKNNKTALDLFKAEHPGHQVFITA